MGAVGAGGGHDEGREALLPESHSLAREETEIREVQGEEFLSERVLSFRHLSATRPHLRRTEPGSLPVPRFEPGPTL